MPTDDLGQMMRLIEALRPWLGETVIVGGWAHRLYRLHPSAGSPAYQPVRTRDADVAFAPTARLEGNMATALKEAGFREELSGEHIPPVSQYRLGEEDKGFYAEFLTPLSGSGTRRNGTPDATVTKAGVTAQKLRHLDLLLAHPWSVALDGAAGVPRGGPAQVRLANPVAFMAQKVLIHSERPTAKQSQDILYVHDTLELFGDHLELLHAEWSEKVRPGMSRPTADRVLQLFREQYGAVTDTIRSATRIPQDRTITPQEMQALCDYGLRAIFA